MTGDKFPVTGNKFLVTGNKFLVTGNKFLVTGNKFFVTGINFLSQEIFLPVGIEWNLSEIPKTLLNALKLIMIMTRFFPLFRAKFFVEN